MDTFVDSSWYYLRFLNPKDESRMVDPERASRWMPVDQYVGGIEHAILHLMYARFVCRVLKDLGLVDREEPFERLFNQGMITRLNPASGKVEKMSKSRGNTVSPDELIARYGADTVRVYTLFIGPPEKESEWSEDGVIGAYRFLHRVHDMCSAVLALGSGPPDATETVHAGTAASDGTPLHRLEHRTIQRVTEDAGRFHFHTAVAALMEFQRAITEALDRGSEDPETLRRAAKTLLRLLHPIAPHITEEWWERLGERLSLLDTPWPRHDPDLALAPRVTLVVQVNGKVRGRLDVERGAGEDEALALARQDEKVQGWLAGRTIQRAIYVPDRLINLVVQ